MKSNKPIQIEIFPKYMYPMQAAYVKAVVGTMSMSNIFIRQVNIIGDINLKMYKEQQRQAKEEIYNALGIPKDKMGKDTAAETHRSPTYPTTNKRRNKY